MRSLLALLLIPSIMLADPARRDTYGDPLPDGALQRLGTGRLKHPGLRRITVTDDGTTVITAGPGSVRRWDARTGKLLRESTVPRPWIIAEATTEDGERTVTYSGKEIEVWNLLAGERTHTLPVPEGMIVEQFLLHPDGKRLLTSGPREKGFELRVWNLKTGKSESIGTAEFQPNRLLLLDDARVVPLLFGRPETRVWNIDDKTSTVVRGHLIWQPRLHRKSGQFPVVQMSKDFWQLLDLETLQPRQQKRLGPIDIGFWLSPDGRTYVRTGEEDEVRDLETDAVRFSFEVKNPELLAFSPDSRYLFVYGDSLRKIEVETGKDIWPLAWSGTGGDVWGVTWSADSKYLVSRQGDDTHFRLWDVESGRWESGWRANGHQHPAIRVWWESVEVDCAGSPPTRFGRHANGAVTMGYIKPEPFAGEDIRPRSVALSPDGNRLTVFGARQNEGHFVQIDLRAEKLGPSGVLHQAKIGQSFGEERFSLDGSLFFLKDRVYRMPSAQPLPRAAGLPGYAYLGATTPGGDLYAHHVFRDLPAVTLPGHEDPYAQDLHVWERCTGREVYRIIGANARDYALHPSGRWVALAEEKGIRIRDLRTGGTARFFEFDATAVPQGRTLPGHAFAFSPDGKRLASAHPDTSILIWDTSDLPPVPKRRLGSDELGKLWNLLREPDAVAAEDAIWQLVGSPETVLSFLREHLRPVAAMKRDTIEPLLKQLDADDFRKRQAAAKKLGEFEDAILPLIDELLKGDLSEEARKLLKTVPGKHAWSEPPFGDDLRLMRAIRLLERLGGDDALKLMENLAGGMTSARATQEAVAARERMRHWR